MSYLHNNDKNIHNEIGKEIILCKIELFLIQRNYAVTKTPDTSIKSHLQNSTEGVLRNYIAYLKGKSTLSSPYFDPIFSMSFPLWLETIYFISNYGLFDFEKNSFVNNVYTLNIPFNGYVTNYWIRFRNPFLVLYFQKHIGKWSINSGVLLLYSLIDLIKQAFEFNSINTQQNEAYHSRNSFGR